MKLAKLTLLVVTLATGCAASSSTLYQARDGVNAAGARIHAKVRPAARPVTASVDRRVTRAVASVGLHVGPTKN